MRNHKLAELENRYDTLKESHKQLIEVLEHVKKDVIWNVPKSPTLDWIKSVLLQSKSL